MELTNPTQFIELAFDQWMHTGTQFDGTPAGFFVFCDRADVNIFFDDDAGAWAYQTRIKPFFWARARYFQDYGTNNS